MKNEENRDIIRLYEKLWKFYHLMNVRSSLHRFYIAFKEDYIGVEKGIVSGIMAALLYYCWPTVEHNAFIFYVFPLLVSIISFFLAYSSMCQVEQYSESVNNNTTFIAPAPLQEKAIELSDYIYNIAIINGFNIFIIGIFYIIKPFLPSFIQGIYLVYMLLSAYELKSFVYNLFLSHQLKLFFSIGERMHEEFNRALREEQAHSEDK